MPNEIQQANPVAQVKWPLEEKAQPIQSGPLR